MSPRVTLTASPDPTAAGEDFLLVVGIAPVRRDDAGEISEIAVALRIAPDGTVIHSTIADTVDDEDEDLYAALGRISTEWTGVNLAPAIAAAGEQPHAYRGEGISEGFVVFRFEVVPGSDADIELENSVDVVWLPVEAVSDDTVSPATADLFGLPRR